jgi:predicted amidophosphoribosyltransferase
MTNHYPFSTILEYIPKRYVGLSDKQQQDRQAVYSFKNGNCPSYVKDLLLSRIRNVVSNNPSTWVVCFIPASSESKHYRRYSALSSYLRAHLLCPVYLDGIEVTHDCESGHMTGKTGNPIENMRFNPNRFKGKRVVLIDDVITRGLTFENTADRLTSLGATSVHGVFLAQTIHPNLPIDNSTNIGVKYYDDVINDIIIDENIQNDDIIDIVGGHDINDQFEIDVLGDDPGYDYSDYF